ncbi:type II secretion system protein GspM [Ramlibacter tataouinensis]|uniref:type II secretion system protein GspM n=1 Tax=Ramlibacter tataouinensis TaxID=94132 RepID=UPI0022F388E6|nr:type II secretion system protein GspM [Ramlibacter tataouinensis]WBY03811.1 type II secretion system protein GspM [Ramlibacter tataouinensis]
MKLPAQWRAAWQPLAPREKLLIAGAAALLLLALLWGLTVAPALSMARSAGAQHRELDAQLARMGALQQQAQALKAQPKQGYDESLRLLEASVRERLGTTARMTVAGERVTLTLAGTPAEALAAWLAQARVNARAVANEARLTRAQAGGWDGTLVLTLPPR